jgi:hypothetical protein
MKYFSIVVLMIFCSCEADKKPVNRKGKTIQEPLPAAEKSIEPEEPEIFIIPELNKKNLHPGKPIVEAPFNPDTAIAKLFPGHFDISTEYSDTFHVVRWMCVECPREEIKELFLDDMTYTFPYETNTTVVAEVKDIEWDKTNYKLLLFYHTESYHPEFSGRYTGAITGAALFIETKKGYELKYFDEVIGMYGAFSHYSSPEIYEAPIPVIDFTFSNGGPGDLYTGIKQLLIPHSGKFKVILTEHFISAGNNPGVEWDTEMKIENIITAGDDQFLILLITKGYFEHEFSESDHYEWILENAPVVLAKKMKQSVKEKKSFNFILTRKYRFEHDHCTLVGTALDATEPDTSSEIH